MHAITIAILFVLIILVFKETRGSVLLSRKAKELNKYYETRESLGYYGCTLHINNKAITQRIRWKVKADEERASLKIMIATSCYRPFALLLQDPTVFFFSLWISFSWAILYMLFSIIPYAYSTVYGFDLQQTGAVFASVSVAAIFATVLSITQEKIAGKYGKLSSTPEGRLSFACYESAFLPIGLFWYVHASYDITILIVMLIHVYTRFGWSCTASYVPSSPFHPNHPVTPPTLTHLPFSRSIHWIIPTLGLSLATIGIFFIYLAVFLYLADTYAAYASSAIAAQSFCRNLLGGAFPLFTKRLFDVMRTPGSSRFGGAGSFLGAVGVVLTVVPWVLHRWGPGIRRRSRWARELEMEKEEGVGRG